MTDRSIDARLRGSRRRGHEHREFALSTIAPIVLLSASGESGEFHPPSISEFFPSAIFFEGSLFEFNRIMLVRVIAAIVLIALVAVGPATWVLADRQPAPTREPAGRPLAAR